MSVPTIDPESSVLSYPQWLTWEHQFSATNSPYDWAITAGAFPTGMTFQPALTGVTGDYTTDTFTSTAHGLANGTAIVFRAKTGGTGLSTNTIYYVVNAATDTFQLATTPGGTVIDFTTSNVSAGTLYRPGYLHGYATVPGVTTVRLTATNGDGTSDEVLFTIGIEPAAAAPDSNADLVWNFGTNDIIAQTSSALNLTPAADGIPILYVKEQDDLIIRLRLLKSGSILDLMVADNQAVLVLKELEPENQVIISDASKQIGTGDASSLLLHAKFNGAALAASLTNYEADSGTYYDALAEIELTFPSPYGDFGPDTLVRTSKTFRLRIERDLGEA
jgi:hypothetical protein